MTDVLVCNAGSTSLKFALYRFPEAQRVFGMKIGGIGRRDAEVFCRREDTAHRYCFFSDVQDYRAGVELFFATLAEEGIGVSSPLLVGFKTVFAQGYHGTHVIDDDVIGAMERGLTVAPAHNRAYLDVIRMFRSMFPSAVLVGAFETEFHMTISEERRVFPLPYEWRERYGVQKYGYHGASHSYVARCVEQLYGAGKKVISMHLGGSSSVCAIKNGKSVDSSFGFSPQSGLFHVARCNEIDPALLPWLEEQGLGQEEILTALNTRSGLSGISGRGGDMRDLEKAYRARDARAMLAVDAFVYAAVKYAGAFYALLGGLDVLVFTGGMGENSVFLRKKICEKLSALGVVLSERKNAVRGSTIREISEGSVTVLIVPADEEQMVAERTYGAVHAAH